MASTQQTLPKLQAYSRLLLGLLMSMVRVREADVKNDRDSDREYRDKRDEEDRDNSLSAKYIENNEATKRDNDGVEEAKDRTNIVRIPYKQLSNVQKDIIQFCSIPRTAKEIMDHIGYYNNSKNMTTYVRPLFFSEIFVGDMGIIVFNWRISCLLIGVILVPIAENVVFHGRKRCFQL